MSERAGSEAWLLLSRASGIGLLLRVVIGISPMVALACTILAADRTLPIVPFVVVALALGCVVLPDSPIGLIVVVLIGIQWWVTVENSSTPWSIAVAAALAVFHTSLAAAGVVPPSAAWTSAMIRRWMRRGATLLLAVPVLWLVTVVVQDRATQSSEILLAASILAMVTAAVWARAGTLSGGRPD